MDYQKEGSFLNNGGYVINFDLHRNSRNETIEKINNLKNGKYLNDQTRIIVIDMTFYNPYSQIYTTLAIELNFKANGLIKVEPVNYLNMMERFYNFSNQSHVLRLFGELIYLVILIVYITIEVKVIFKHVRHNFETFKKKQEFQEFKETRKLKRMK
jgi:DNA integrity scanning protein DisA with diadenylate cyclase activity